MSISSLAVFCGAREGNNPLHKSYAIQLTKFMTDNKLTLVYGGAKVGLMGLLADQVLAQAGRVVGVIPKSLITLEVAHESLNELHIVDSMHERKALMYQLADAFLLLPGGIGSLDEFFEIYTWHQLGLHNKPFGILNINGYYNDLIKFLDHATDQAFLPKHSRESLFICEEINQLGTIFDTKKSMNF